jgi:hypothetical protein
MSLLRKQEPRKAIEWIPAFGLVAKVEIASSAWKSGLLAMTQGLIRCHCEAAEGGRGNLNYRTKGFGNKPLRGNDLKIGQSQ